MQIYFQASSLVLLFFISVALKQYVILGIDLAFVYSCFITLFAAKRFGAIKAVVIGFVSSFGVSATLSVAFALLGLGAGFFFAIAPLYAFLAGGALLGAWSAYSGGLVGFLSVFPEFASGAALFFPLIKNLDRERCEQAREDIDKAAADMITGVALAKRNENGAADKLTASLSAMASQVARFGKNDGEVPRERLVDTMIKAAKISCDSCELFSECKSVNPAPCAEIIDDLTTNICKNGRITRQDLRFLPDYCKNKERLFAAFSTAAGAVVGEKIKNQRLSLISDNLELVTKMINDTRLFEDGRWQVDKALSERIQSKLYEVGLARGVAKVFGDRIKNFIIAGEDKTGELVSSKQLRNAIESSAGIKLSSPEFFKRGDLSLMTVKSGPILSADFASSSTVARGSDVSGDSVGSFISDDGYFYSIISDGMGTGECAKEVSLFVCDFMKNILSASVSLNVAIGLLNGILRNKVGECSATLDLYRLDLLSGEATFLKSGAAHSYVKRGDSLFRIRSETAPLGLMKQVDAEKIKIEIKPGDLVIMFSDGVAASPESSVWLPELLSRDFEGSIEEYAEFILAEAMKNARFGDDATVSVTKIKSRKAS
jgi:stage II sporulation protein E